MSSSKPTPKFNYREMKLDASRFPLKAPFAMTPEGITIHETDNNATAAQEIAYMQGNPYTVSYHLATDANEVVQGVPFDRSAWHAGDGLSGFGNRKTIGIEITGNYIRSIGRYVTPDMSEYQNYLASRANAERAAGWLLFIYNWDGSKINTHRDRSGKNCPAVMLREGYLDTFRKNAEKYRDSYKAAVEAPTVVTVPNIAPFTEFKIGQRVKIKLSAGRYANVDKFIPDWVKQSVHTIDSVNKSTNSVLLREIRSWVKMHDIEGYKVQEAPTKQTFAVGDMVTVKEGAKSYDGVSVIKEWYTTPKRIDGINGLRVVLDANNWCTAFNLNDLVAANKVTPTPTPAPQVAQPKPAQFSIGDRVTASGYPYRDSYGQGRGAQTRVTGPILYINMSGSKPYNVSGVGWFAASDVTKSGWAVGQRVLLVGTTYQTGQTIPASYRNRYYTILQVDSANNRVLVKELYSWVRMSDIR